MPAKSKLTKTLQTAGATVLMSAAAVTAQAGDRFPILKPEALSAEQNQTLKNIMSGPRARAMTPEGMTEVLSNGPFNAWLYSPDLGDRLQRVGEFIRYKTSIPLYLNEFAILITARVWTSQYEWYAHYPIAIKAGLDPRLAAELADGKRPANMKPDEAAVYDFCMQLHREKKVSDANYQKVKAIFGEKGVMDLIGVSGYYTAVSMTLNVGEVAVPAGTPLPLKPLD